MINFFIHFSFIFSVIFWTISLIILVLGPDTVQNVIEGIDTLLISISFMIFCFMLSNNIILFIIFGTLSMGILNHLRRRKEELILIRKEGERKEKRENIKEIYYGKKK